MTNNSGMTFRRFNLLERALSSDLNEAQLFGSQGIMELFRRLFFAPAEVNSVGFLIESQPVTSTTPLTAYVAGGLLVNPQGTSLLVDPGTLLAIAPDGSPDPNDSVCIVAHSPGVVSAGALTFTANGGASPRWDLLECRPVTSSTTSVRDIYNPTTQAFVGTSVTKLITTTLEFRIRTGTTGSPLAPAPSMAAGWLPIAAIWVPTSAASFDDCELFDVRPLVSELSDYGRAQKGVAANNLRTTIESVYNTRLNGSASARFVGPGRKWNLAGRIAATDPSQNVGDLDGFNASLNIPTSATTPPYWENGLNAIESVYMSLFLVFPFGLPRWVRLGRASEAVAGRRWPGGCGGFFVVSTRLPGRDYMGSVCGLSNNYLTSGTYDAVCVSPAVTKANTGPGLFPSLETFIKTADGLWRADNLRSIALTVTTSSQTFAMTRALGVSMNGDTTGPYFPAGHPISCWLGVDSTIAYTIDAANVRSYISTRSGSRLSRFFLHADGGGGPINTGTDFPDIYGSLDPKGVTASVAINVAHTAASTAGYDLQEFSFRLRELQISLNDEP